MQSDIRFLTHIEGVPPRTRFRLGRLLWRGDRDGDRARKHSAVHVNEER